MEANPKPRFDKVFYEGVGRMKAREDKQAEITRDIAFKACFKAGMEHCREQNPEAWDREQSVFEDGKQTGIREVMEWVESHDESNCMDCSCAYDFMIEEWQDFLKSKGIGK